MYDYVIRNALIVDGTGDKGFLGSIAIKDGKIVAIGEVSDTDALQINAESLVACPGFIDMHSHTDLRILDDLLPEEKIRQGITTELFGQDGLGVAPVDEENIQNLATIVAGLLGKRPVSSWTWRSFSDYLDVLEQHKLPNNVAVLASHGPIRLRVVGMENRQASQKELEQMAAVLKTTFEEGAFGLSTGLIYPPCSYGDENELTALTKVVAEFNGPFIVHQRDEGYLIRTAFSELLRVSQKTGCHLHISHLQAYGQVNWPLIDDIFEMAETRLQRGGELTWDRYPYIAGCTVLSAVLPNWTFSMGTEQLIQSLMEDDFRARIREDFSKGLDVWNNRSISVGWGNIYVTSVGKEKNKPMEGKSCAELAEQTGKDPIDFVCDLLAEEKLGVTMISFYGSDDVMERVICHPSATVGSDGIFGGKPHPRLLGCYPKYLQYFVREKKLLSLEEAIRKVTKHPAEILGISDRGQISEGYWADIVLFDPTKVTDNATYENPFLTPEGIEYVFVNGQPVIENSSVTGKTPGKVLRKTLH